MFRTVRAPAAPAAEVPESAPTVARQVAAWAVHLLTASGVVLALLALDAVERGEFHQALLWLLAALAVDGIDGTLARAVRVAEVLPRIDGAALDLVVDYLTYVLVPALLIWRSGLLPPGVAVPLCAAILVASLYVFVRRDMKTADGYFRGFPALWNVVAIYFVLTPPAPWAAAAIVAVLVVLVFAPVHVVHPFRARDSRKVAPAAAIAWVVSTATLALPALPESWRSPGLGVSLASLLLLAAIGLRRTASEYLRPTVRRGDPESPPLDHPS